MPDWLRQALQQIKPLLPKDFVGQIEINTFKGGISRINVKQAWEGKEIDIDESIAS